MKKFLKVLFIIILIGAIAFLGYSLYQKDAEKTTAETQLSALAFIEGDVTKNTGSGGTVTVAMDWCVSKDDTILSGLINPSDYKKVSQVFCELYEAGYLEGYSNNLVKIKYDKIITVETNSSNKSTYYYVNGYYVADLAIAE